MRLPPSRAHHGTSSAIQMGRVLKNLQRTNRSLIPRSKTLTIQELVPNVVADASVPSESGPTDGESSCGSSSTQTTPDYVPQGVECPASNHRGEASSSHGRRKNSIVAFEDGKRVYPCEICGKTFASGRALGGHKRCHRVKKAVEEALCSINRVKVAVDKALDGPERSCNRGNGALIFRRKARAEHGGSPVSTPQVTEGISKLHLDGESTEEAAQPTEERMLEGPKKLRGFDLNIPYEEKEEN